MQGAGALPEVRSRPFLGLGGKLSGKCGEGGVGHRRQLEPGVGKFAVAGRGIGDDDNAQAGAVCGNVARHRVLKRERGTRLDFEALEGV